MRIASTSTTIGTHHQASSVDGCFAPGSRI